MQTANQEPESQMHAGLQMHAHVEKKSTTTCIARHTVLIYSVPYSSCVYTQFIELPGLSDMRLFKHNDREKHSGRHRLMKDKSTFICFNLYIYIYILYI